MNIANNGKCVTCEEGSQLFDPTSRACVDCGTVFSRCSTCSKDKCLSCEEGKSYHYVEDTGMCSTCSELYGSGCADCNETHCTKCTDNDCCDDGEQIIATDGVDSATCGTCAIVDENCIECTSEVCTKCKDNTMFVKDGKCVSCSDEFEGCSRCTADMCLECINTNPYEMILTFDGCYPNDTAIIDEPSSSEKPSSSSSSSLPPTSSVSPSSTPASSQPVVAPSSTPKDKDGGSKTGMIVGIVIGCVAAVAIVALAIYCLATNGRKHGKVDADIFEGEDSNWVSMSVL